MNVTACILFGLLSVAYAGVVVATEESPPVESSQPKASNTNAPDDTREKPGEEFEVERSEEPLDTFVPSEQVSPDSSISFPVDI